MFLIISHFHHPNVSLINFSGYLLEAKIVFALKNKDSLMIRAFINKKNIESILLNENTCQIKTSIKRFQGSADSLVSTKRLHIKLGLLKYVWTPSTKESNNTHIDAMAISYLFPNSIKPY